MARFDPGRRDFSPYGFNCVRWTPTRMPRFDRHNEVELNLLESGELTYLIGGKKVTVSAGRLAAFWAGVPHRIIGYRATAEYFVMTVPLAWFLQWRLPDSFSQPILQGAVLMEADDSHQESDVKHFATWEEDLASGTEERLEVCLLEVRARLARMASRTQKQPRANAGRKSATVMESTNLSRAEAMACYIAQHGTHRLSIGDVADHAGLHPNYAMVLFQQTFGTTILKYIVEYRLSNAQRLLVTTDDLVENVAYQSGFGSLSSFNAAFRRTFGCTPRQYRQSHRTT